MRDTVLGQPTATGTVVGLPEFDDVLPITVDDQTIEARVADADLPALLAALAMLTGDETLISEQLRPPTPPMGAAIAPQGGMSPEVQEKARALVTRALIDYRDRGCPPPAEPAPDLLNRIMRFLTKDAGDEYLPLLLHELALPTDLGVPTWRKDDVAPDVNFTVAVIGAGISGLVAAHRLQQAGVSFVVFEKNGDVGGTWWDNRYPGCRLDTPNYAYSFSFAQKPDWPQQFSRQPEIHKYLARIACGFSLREHIRFETEVETLTYDDRSASWTVVARDRSGATQTHRVQAVITAVGQLNRPSYPDIKGRERFAGPAFHSAEWNTDLDLTGLRVAVIGTGASAYQIVPSVVDQVSELKVFQRNPPWMMPTPNYHHDIKAGMHWLLRHVPYYGRWFRFWQFWIAAEGRLPLVEVEPGWEHPVSVGSANEALRRECMANLEQQLVDRPDLLPKLTPTYPPGAKRMLRDNGVWVAALKQDHVDLVTDPIAEISESGIITTDGREHEVDIIVFATGFKAADYLEPIRITGRDGRDLHQWWSGDARAYLGITVPHFPNLFMTAGPNTSVVVNGSAIFSAECAVEYTVAAIGKLLADGHRAMDCREDPFWRYNEWVDAGNLGKAWGVAKTTSWYKNASGRASQTWPFPLVEYWNLTRDPDLADYELL
jgi:4-hydroxyacetophenone monooxygenase